MTGMVSMQGIHRRTNPEQAIGLEIFNWVLGQILIQARLRKGFDQDWVGSDKSGKRINLKHLNGPEWRTYCRQIWSRRNVVKSLPPEAARPSQRCAASQPTFPGLKIVASV